VEKHRRKHDYQLGKRSYWNVFRLEIHEAPAQDETERTAEPDGQSLGAYLGNASEFETRD
jgi:hypothetical protein